MYQETVTIVCNEAVAPGYYRMGLQCPAGFLDAVPGQFIMLRVGPRTQPLLRRPFSIHRVSDHGGGSPGLDLLYQVVGQGTRQMADKRPGDRLDILGPLGKGFRYHPHWKRMMMVAGGIGVAPLVFLAQSMQKNRIDLSESHVFLGGRSRGDLLCADDFSGLSMQVHLTTDDGSEGDQCLVTHPFEQAALQNKPDVVFACGPMPMLGCVVGVARKLGVPCQVSIETMMACGMGACLGCALPSVKDPAHYLHGCMDGPVFDAHEIDIE